MKRFPLPNEALILPWTPLVELLWHVDSNPPPTLFFASNTPDWSYVAVNSIDYPTMIWIQSLGMAPQRRASLYICRDQWSFYPLLQPRWSPTELSRWVGGVTVVKVETPLRRKGLRWELSCMVWCGWPSLNRCSGLTLTLVCNLHCVAWLHNQEKKTAHKMPTGPLKGNKNA